MTSAGAIGRCGLFLRGMVRVTVLKRSLAVVHLRKIGVGMRKRRGYADSRHERKWVGVGYLVDNWMTWVVDILCRESH